MKLYRYRDASTGRFVHKDYALANPNTTIRQLIVWEKAKLLYCSLFKNKGKKNV